MDPGPVAESESAESKVVVVHLESKPGPFHRSCFSLILMEIFEGFCLFSCNCVEFRISIDCIFDLVLAIHGSSLVERLTSDMSLSRVENP